MGALRWSNADLSHFTGASVSTARRWVVGTAPVPEAVLRWVVDVADVLDHWPPPVWTEDGWVAGETWA
jgi:hypothetical protein